MTRLMDKKTAGCHIHSTHSSGQLASSELQQTPSQCSLPLVPLWVLPACLMQSLPPHCRHTMVLIMCVTPAACSRLLSCLQRLLTHMHFLVYELRRREKLNLTPNGSSSSSGGGALDSVPPAAAELVVLPHTCGARLLHWLHDRKAHGEPLLQSCTQRLLWHVHQVMFNQLAMWYVAGRSCLQSSRAVLQGTDPLMHTGTCTDVPACRASPVSQLSMHPCDQCGAHQTCILRCHQRCSAITD